MYSCKNEGLAHTAALDHVCLKEVLFYQSISSPDNLQSQWVQRNVNEQTVTRWILKYMRSFLNLSYKLE